MPTESLTEAPTGALTPPTSEVPTESLTEAPTEVLTPPTSEVPTESLTEAMTTPTTEVRLTYSDLEYKKILEERIQKINEKIKSLESKDSVRAFNELEGLKVELEALKQMANHPENRTELGFRAERKLSNLDKKREIKDRKRAGYQEQIDILKAKKSELVTNRAKKIIDKRIAHFQKKVDALKKADVSCGKKQRKILRPRYMFELRSQHLLSLAEGKVNAYETRIHENEELISILGGGFRDSVRERIYDIKGHYYQKRKDRAEEILSEMRTRRPVVNMIGARITSLSKHHLRRLIDDEYSRV